MVRPLRQDEGGPATGRQDVVEQVGLVDRLEDVQGAGAGLLVAAEAAIANPLLDETSMKGAKGLLISITGGRDLTLFEVDEAATRIREEVDADANIILGAFSRRNLSASA